MFLDGALVQAINADLSAMVDEASVDLTAAKTMKANAGISFMGITKSGPFDVEGSLARQWLAMPNPHGKPNSDVLAPSLNNHRLKPVG